MKALTICIPWSHLIVSPAEELRDGDLPKRVENRTWATDFRGTFLIHAGKNKSWLRPGDEARYPNMLMGYVLGTADLLACIPCRWAHPDDAEKELPEQFKWVAHHPHCRWGDGSYWWVLGDVRRFAVPVKARGQQGLFDLPGDWELKKHDAQRMAYEPPRRRIQLEA